MEKDSDIEKLYEALENSHNTVAITGAGISISAGGVTFSGMLTHMGPGIRRNKDPEKLYQSLYRTFLKSIFENGPTEAHKALASLEKHGKLQGIITTNEDCLHTIAGSKNVAELEGSYQVNTCDTCGHRNYNYKIWGQGHMPVCPECGGMMLPYDLYSHAGLWQDGLDKAREWIAKAELILVIGTHGYYGSAYWGYRNADARIIQINPRKTDFDAMAELNIREEADPVFQSLMKLEKNQK